MDSSTRTAMWIIATGVLALALYFLREPLTQFALALLLWLAIHGFAKGISRRVPRMPKALAVPLALVLVLSIVTLVVYVVARNITAMASNIDGYGARLDQVVAQAYATFGLGAAPTVSELISRADPGQLVGDIAGGVQTLISYTIFILIYLGFLFPAGHMIAKKMDLIFSTRTGRRNAREVMASVRTSMERYLWVQTIVSVIITILTYITLTIIGLENAVFWSFLIFFLNYIPTIGSIVGTVLPTAFALVQFPTLGPVIAVAAGVGFWQFVIGNFIQPRMTGDSLNLSAIVVLLALAVWGTIWGIPGAFLAAPLTVMLMIILAQFPETRWIAILLSADGKPTPESAPVHNDDDD